MDKDKWGDDINDEIKDMNEQLDNDEGSQSEESKSDNE